MEVRLAKHVIITRTLDGMVLLDQRSGRCWQINESGAAALDQLLGGACARTAAAALSADYDVTPERAHDDVVALVESLQAGHLVLPP